MDRAQETRPHSSSRRQQERRRTRQPPLKTGGFECDIALAESENDFREALSTTSFDLNILD
jgi:hypothetical protein